MLVAAPMWKLWLEKFPIMTGEARTQHSQVAKVACVRGRQSAWRKRDHPALLFNWQISHQSMNGAKRVIPSADMNVTTFVKRSSLGSFYMKAQARRSHLRVNGHVRNTQMLIRHKTCETGNWIPLTSKGQSSLNYRQPKTYSGWSKINQNLGRWSMRCR